MNNKTYTKLAAVVSTLLLGVAITLLAAEPNLNPPERSRPVLLQWMFPAEKMSTNVTFKVYHSTNLTTPKTNWLVITNVVGTNVVVFPAVPGINFYSVTASNFWGESGFSSVVSTPDVLLSGDLTEIRIQVQD